MKNFYYDLSGGINLAQSKIALGMNDKKMYWADAQNIEIYQNRGIVRMKGNSLAGAVSGGEAIAAICEYKKGGDFVLVTRGAENSPGAEQSGGGFYYCNALSGKFELKKRLGLAASSENMYSFGANPVCIVNYLNGVVVTNGVDAPFYFEAGRTVNSSSAGASGDGAGAGLVLEEIVEIGAQGADGKPVRGCAAAVFAGRLWIGGGSTLWYSALGTYDDWTTAEDAGYISDFHVSTSEITCLKVYRDNLAIYKEDGVYLLTGSSPADFAVVPFADKGAAGPNSVLTLNNKQYFFNRYGVFALEQVGELAQLALSDNIAANIAPAFEDFDELRLSQTFVVPYEAKNQVWFLVPGKGGGGVSGLSGGGGTTIWVYDYVCRAWMKRVVPQNITAAACVSGRVLSGDALGRVFEEDITSFFDGEPVNFRFSSPFLTLGEPNRRKTVEEFYFIFDEARDNKFDFAVSKDYLSSEKDDLERISDFQPRAVIWDSAAGDAANASVWALASGGSALEASGAEGALASEGGSGGSGAADFWAEAVESAYKTEINDSNLAVQLHFEGREPQDDLAVIGLEFKEVYYD